MNLTKKRKIEIWRGYIDFPHWLIDNRDAAGEIIRRLDVTSRFSLLSALCGRDIPPPVSTCASCGQRVVSKKKTACVVCGRFVCLEKRTADKEKCAYIREFAERRGPFFTKHRNLGFCRKHLEAVPTLKSDRTLTFAKENYKFAKFPGEK